MEKIMFHNLNLYEGEGPVSKKNPRNCMNVYTCTEKSCLETLITMGWGQFWKNTLLGI